MSLEKRVTESWPAAQRLWASSILLSDPTLSSNIQPLAYTDLETRRVVVNSEIIVRHDLARSIEAILAHEVGHHIQYPGTLSLSARLRLLETQLLPLRNYSFLNLFTDFLINEHVGRTHREQLIAVYRAGGTPTGDPPFCFYLACYEELWALEPGALLQGSAAWMEKEYPGYRGEAQMLAQDLFNLAPNIFTQFIYFVSVFARYLPADHDPPSGNPLDHDHSQPGPDDYADALVPTGAEEEAIDRALKEGWIPAAKKGEWTPDEVKNRRIASLPGTLGNRAHLIPEIMAAHYRRLASAYLVNPPPQKRFGDPLVPTTFEEWEPGEPTRDIDWRGTISQRGDQVGVAQPLKREREEAEEGTVATPWRPRMEIYLDVSGSMPDPKTRINAMTLAAQILCLSTIRHEGKVRALIYSGNVKQAWEWMRSELHVSKFLMNYIGGGTVFPFDILAQSTKEYRTDPPIRVVITDTDFDHNYDNTPGAAATFEEAARLSRPLVLLLHHPVPTRVTKYQKAGARVVSVDRLDDFPRLAADLAKSLFGKGVRP